MAELAQRQGIFYGYYLAMLTFLLGFTSGAIYLYSRGVFVRDQIVDFGASRTEISLTFTTVAIVSACFAPVLGYLLDRCPIKRITIAGACLVASDFILLSQVQNLVQFSIIAAIFLGFGIGGMGTAANTKLMVNWFNRNRGFALSIAIMGYSVAGTVMSPIALFMLDNFGWHTSYMIFASFALLVIAPLIAIMVKQSPAEMGLGPDGDATLQPQEKIEQDSKHPDHQPLAGV